MAVLGISYSAAGNRPAAMGVVAQGSIENLELEELFSYEGDEQEDRAEALLGLVDKVDSVLSQHSVDVVVVNSMDEARRAQIRLVKMWFSMEGALLSVARRRTQRVYALTGHQIGSKLHCSKAEAEARAESLLSSSGLERAGAAALAALVAQQMP